MKKSKSDDKITKAGYTPIKDQRVVGLGGLNFTLRMKITENCIFSHYKVQLLGAKVS